MVFNDYRPVAQHHLLVIPKRHVGESLARVCRSTRGRLMRGTEASAKSLTKADVALGAFGYSPLGL